MIFISKVRDKCSECGKSGIKRNVKSISINHSKVSLCQECIEKYLIPKLKE